MAVGKPEFIIAGLGNPGKQYELTHHNAGFLCMDVLCNKLGVRCDKVKWQALVTTAVTTPWGLQNSLIPRTVSMKKGLR